MLHELMIAHCYPADNIVPLYTYCEDPSCLVFQYMENGTLYDKLQDTVRPLTWKQRANIAMGIARGLYHLHANNVVHGDIKGQNILLDKHLEAKIGDFGTNRLLYSPLGDTVTWINLPSMAGTRDYLPNWYVAHQNGKIVRKQIDVYSFGMVMLEIMSGRPQGDTWRDSNHRTLRDFVNNDMPNHSEPPSEYVSPSDDEQRIFRIEVEEEVDGRTQRVSTNVDWAKMMFDIGRQCTMYDQTPWRGVDRFNNPTPWRTMQENNITMANLYQILEDCYTYYLMSIGENANEYDPDVEAMGLRTARRVESGFLSNPNDSEEMDP